MYVAARLRSNLVKILSKGRKGRGGEDNLPLSIHLGT